MTVPLTFKERMALRAAGGTAPMVTEKLPEKAPDPAPLTKPSGFSSKFKKTPLPELDPAPAPGLDLDLGEATPLEPAKKVEAPLPKVIQAYNQVGGQAKATEGDLLGGVKPEAAIEQIRQKIADLAIADNQTDLKYEMTKLSEMLVANPSACLYLHDEDLGQAVRAMRALTNNRVAQDLATSKPSAKSKASANKPLSLEDMQDALDAL